MHGGSPTSGGTDPVILEPDPSAPVGPSFAKFPAQPATSTASGPVAEPASPEQQLEAERYAGDLGQLTTTRANFSLIRGALGGNALRVGYIGRGQTFTVSGGGPVLSRKVREGYRVATLIRAPVALTICLRIQVRTAADPSFPHTTERCRTSTGRWSRMTVKASSHRRGDRVRVSLNVLGALPGDAFDLDDLNLKRS